MGYYDDDGHYHSFRRGIQRVAERIAHPVHGPSLLRHHHHHHQHGHREGIEREEVSIIKEREVEVPEARHTSHGHSQGHSHGQSYDREEADQGHSRAMTPNTITIPCHHIRIGDLLILQGRPCQVIRITTSAQTGQHRYLGVDLFSKQLHEESSFISSPAPSVIVQNMLGPVFKQYRVLDIRDDGSIVAMTETGDVKQSLPVLDQSSLFSRLTNAFDNGRGSIRVLVLTDKGEELIVDYKVVHGSRL
jgi:Eukaryotic elongation factor 5A hypusine, DNA-binding OB fold